jgi:hypothetical protein
MAAKACAPRSPLGQIINEAAQRSQGQQRTVHLFVPGSGSVCGVLGSWVVFDWGDRSLVTCPECLLLQRPAEKGLPPIKVKSLWDQLQEDE